MTKSEILSWVNGKKGLKLKTENIADGSTHTHTVYYADGSVYQVRRTFDRCSLVFNCFHQDVVSYSINGDLVLTEIL